MGSLKECGEQGERGAGVGGLVNSWEEGMPVAGGMSVAGGTCQKLSGAGGMSAAMGACLSAAVRAYPYPQQENLEIATLLIVARNKYRGEADSCHQQSEKWDPGQQRQLSLVSLVVPGSTLSLAERPSV